MDSLSRATKNRVPFFTKNVKQKLIKHIMGNAIKKDIYIDSIDGGKEHLLLLVSLGVKQSVAEITQALKSTVSMSIANLRLA